MCPVEKHAGRQRGQKAGCGSRALGKWLRDGRLGSVARVAGIGRWGGGTESVPCAQVDTPAGAKSGIRDGRATHGRARPVDDSRRAVQLDRSR